VRAVQPARSIVAEMMAEAERCLRATARLVR
jgi:hypothetical protein